MKIKKMKIGTFNLKKYIFLYTKGQLSNGETLGHAEYELRQIIIEISKMFYTAKGFNDPAKMFPFAYDKDGNQIGCKVEDYKDA